MYMSCELKVNIHVYLLFAANFKSKREPKSLNYRYIFLEYC